MRMKRYSPVGDQNPSLAQLVRRRASRTAIPTAAQLNHPGTSPVRRNPAATARKKTALGTAATTSSVHVRSKSALASAGSPAPATENASTALSAVATS
jgi:hypothetical protein